MSAVPASVERTKPYLLVVGEIDDEAIKAYLDGLGNGVAYTHTPEGVRQADFDFAVVMNTRSLPQFEGNASVLHFHSGEYIGPVANLRDSGTYSLGRPTRRHYDYSVLRHPGQRASAFEVMDNPGEQFDFRSLITDTLLPNVHRGGDYDVVAVSGRTDHKIIPMMWEQGGRAIAAVVEFPELKSFWSVPSQATDRLRWIEFFLNVMKRTHPECFPPEQVGLTNDWRTSGELDAHRAVMDHKAVTAQIIQEREQELAALEEQMEAATEAADSGDRILLTTQGDVLVKQVTEVLTGFGFVVEDRDQVSAANKASKKEDLRITHPTVGADDWVAVVEVKGYRRGAKANDLRQLATAVGVFSVQEQRMPSAQWYVVNHHRTEPAQLRPEPLVSNGDEVEGFATDGGLVVDTRWLFQLKKRVDMGAMTATEAAEALVFQTGVFTLPDDKHLSKQEATATAT